MLEFCATLSTGLPGVEPPVNARGIKANSRPIRGTE